MKFNPKSSIPSGSAVAHGGNPQDRAASPKSKIELPNAHYLGVLSNEGVGDAAGLGIGENVAALLISSLY